MNYFIKDQKLNERYVLENEIGSGNFGQTWKALDTVLNIPVAIKIFHNPDINKKEKYLKEARTLASFRNVPGIVQVLDFFNFEDYFCLVMEYLEGQSLVDYVKKHGTFDLEKLTNLLLPVFDAVNKIHDNNIIHRDISPDNIYVTNDNETKLLDFGSSLGMQAKAGTLTVKPGFAPTEQYRDLSEIGPWTDIYGLAATIYYCITGTIPTDSLQRELNDTLVLPSQISGNITSSQEKAIMEALSINPKVRTQNIELFKKALLDSGQKPKETAPSPTISNEPTIKRETNISINNRTSKKKKMNPKRKFVLGGAILVLIIILVLLFINLINSTTNKKETIPTIVSIQNEAVTPEHLSEFEKHPEVDKLSLNTCVVDDKIVEAISKISRLKEIKIEKCTGFTNLNPLSSLKELEKFTLTYNGNCKDPSFIAGLSSLKTLDVDGLDFNQGNANEIFKDHPKMYSITLIGCTMSNMNWLSSVPSIYELKINKGNISDISAIKYCKNLTSLELPNNNISDINILNNKSQIISLDFTNNHISDASPCGSIKDLNSLKLGNNNISDIGFLKNLLKIKTLDLGSNKIKDISSLDINNQLWWVALNNNSISDISCFNNNFSKLQYLNISTNSITSIEPLTSCNDIRQLVIAGNKIQSLKGLENHDKLETLAACNNQINDISALGSSLNKMQKLDLAYNQINDASILNSLKPTDGLGVTLFLEHNKITDISWIPSDSTFLSLSLYENKIIDISPFNNCKKLSSLMFSYYPQIDFTTFDINKFNLSGIFVTDVPDNEKNNVRKSINFKSNIQDKCFNFCTSQEADQKIGEERARIAKISQS